MSVYTQPASHPRSKWHPVNMVDEGAEFAGVDEEVLFAEVAAFAVVVV